MGYCIVSEEELNVGIIYGILTKFKKLLQHHFTSEKRKLKNRFIYM